MASHVALRSRRLMLWPVVALVAAAAVVASMLFATSARGATVALSGVVHNASGTALGGVTVTAAQSGSVGVAPDVTTTSATGAFAFGALPQGNYSLSFSATSTTYFQYLGDTSDPKEQSLVTLNYTTEGNGNVYLPVDLAASGTISGKVETTTGAAIKSYTVRAYQQGTDGTWSIVGSGKTGTTGLYSITGLEPGTFALEAIDLTDAHPTYPAVFSGYWPDPSDATQIGVLAGKTSSYTFELGKSGSVSGTVLGAYGASSTEALGGVRVTAYQLVGSGFPYASATALNASTTTTGANGSYTLAGLLPGPYTLEFQPSAAAAPAPSSLVYGRTFLGNSDSATAAGYFQIGNGTSVTGENVTLTAEATLSGTIDNSATNAGAANIEVIADYVGQNPDDPNEHPASTLTASDGSFSLTGLGAGVYDLYLGSNVSTNPSVPSVGDTGFVRRQLTLGALTAGENATFFTDVTAKTDGGMVDTTQPSISDPDGPDVGDTVTASVGTWDSTPTSYTYQWYNSVGPIAGATSASYVLRPGDAGQFVTVHVTASNFGYGSGTATSTSTPSVGLGTIEAPSPGATISGTGEVGTTLTANPGEWSVSGVSFLFDWQTSPDGSVWSSLGLPSSPKLTVTPDVFDAGPHIRVVVEGNRAGYNSTSATVTLGSDATTAPITMIKAPTVAKSGGNFELVGGTFSPSAAATSNTGTVWSYESPSGGGGGTTALTLPIAQYAGYYIYATQQRVLNGYTTFTTPDIPVQTGVAPTATSNTAITGTPQIGNYLDAPNANWTQNSGTFSYLWEYKSGTTWRAIPTATMSSLLLTSGYLGKVLRVIETLHNAGFANGTLISQEPGAIVAGAAPIYLNTNTTGEFGTGDTVTATSNWSGNPTSFGYQWESAPSQVGPFTKIPGATKPSFVILQSLLNKYLFVEETASEPGYVTGSNLLGLGQVFADQLTLVKAATVKVVGSNYVVTPPTFSPASPAPTITYSWYYDDENDANPTQDMSFNGPTADIASSIAPHAHWYVVASVQHSGDGPYSYTTPTQTLVRKGDIIPSGPITLGPSNVGAQLFPSAITWLVESPTLTYQWEYLSGSKWIAIAAKSGGTGASFTPSSTYLGHELRVITTASRANYTTASVTSSTTTVGIGAVLTPNTGQQLTGTVAVGDKLTAVPGTWSQSGVTFSYEWDSSPDNSTWTKVVGATASTFTIPDAAYNTLYYRVVIRASKAGFTPGSTTLFGAGKAAEGQLNDVKSPIVKYASGKYTVSGGTWSATPTSYDYTWSTWDRATDTATQVGADAASYTPTSADAGKLLTVQVTAHRAAYADGNTGVTARLGSAIEPNSPITLTGNIVIGANLSLDIPGWNTDSTNVHILWYRNGVATGTYTDDLDYTLGAPDFGKAITARVIASAAGYVTSTFAFTSALIQSNVVLLPSTQPTIVGTVAADDTVSANPGVWNVPGVTFTYQWYHDDIAIPAATSVSYTVGGAYVGQDLTVAVRANKSLYTSTTDETGSVTIAEGAAITNTLAHPIALAGATGGNAKLGTTITATVGGKWNMPVSLTYQWVWQAGPAYEYMVGANGASFLAQAGDTGSSGVGSLSAGDALYVIITATRLGHPSVQTTSPALNVVN